MKKHEFHAVFMKGDVNPKALFIKEKDAVLYDYMRFGDPYEDEGFSSHEVCAVMLVAKKAYNSLPFKEGLAFNKVMKTKNPMFRGV